MTPIRPVTILCAHATLTRTAAAAAMGCAIGFAAAIACMQYVQADTGIAAYRLMKSACKFPQFRGEAATWAIGSDGEINCWEQRDKGDKR